MAFRETWITYKAERFGSELSAERAASDMYSKLIAQGYYAAVFLSRYEDDGRGFDLWTDADLEWDEEGQSFRIKELSSGS